MSTGQLLEEIANIQAILGDSVAYTQDTPLWEAVSRLSTLVAEIVAKLPEGRE
jgi:hypothetical protein